MAYRITSGAQDKFIIDTETGVISVSPGARLDPELTEPPTFIHLLEVTALDGGVGVQQRSEIALVNITITDVNNKPPRFMEPGTVHLSENANIGEYIKKVNPRAY